VYLENGYTFHKTPYGKGVAINDVRGLHAMIGRMIARRQAPDRRRAAFAAQGDGALSQSVLAAPFGDHGAGRLAVGTPRLLLVLVKTLAGASARARQASSGGAGVYQGDDAMAAR
jgi:hypothetical protein